MKLNLIIPRALTLLFLVPSSSCIDTSIPDLSGTIKVRHQTVPTSPDSECRDVDQLCDDHNHCTVDDRCTASMHCVGALLNCDDGQACTSERCHPATGDCEYDTSACSCDDDYDCNDGAPCTEDRCTDSYVCHSEITPRAPCDDDDPCTGESRCDDAGACIAGVHWCVYWPR